MAQSRIVSSVSRFDIQHFTELIQSLQISNEIREELRECLHSFADIDLNSLRGRSDDSTCKNAMILLNKFAKVVLDVLEACGFLPPPLGNTLRLITEVVEFVFEQDVASAVINRFTAILDADLIRKCTATCGKIILCITYIQGIPKRRLLTPQQRGQQLQMAASDFPVSTGLDEVLILEKKIRDLVKVADMKSTGILLEHVQCYCCLTTFWELFALYRFAIQSDFFIDADSIKNVIEKQRSNDKEVLKFLYRPSTRTVRLFRSCNANQWPILTFFLLRRGLHTEKLSELSGRTIVIKSVSNIGKALGPCMSRRLCKGEFLSLIDEQNDASFLELRGCLDNVFTIWSRYYNPPRQVYCDEYSRMRIGEDEPPPSYSRFYILKLQPETPQETPCYMIWLEHDNTKCVKVYLDGVVGLSSDSKPGKRYFWQLEDVP